MACEIIAVWSGVITQCIEFPSSCCFPLFTEPNAFGYFSIRCNSLGLRLQFTFSSIYLLLHQQQLLGMRMADREIERERERKSVSGRTLSRCCSQIRSVSEIANCQTAAGMSFRYIHYRLIGSNEKTPTLLFAPLSRLVWVSPRNIRVHI